MTLVYPGAVFRPVRNHGGGLGHTAGLVLHVQVGTGSLWNWFDNPNSQVSAHWWVSASGLVEQYVSCDVVAWAQAAGNGTYCSVETEGYPDTALTEAQINALAGIYRWGHDTFGWPFSPTDTPGVAGFGWHGMGGTAYGNHPGCPGDLRKNQRAVILRIASGQTIPGGGQQPPLQPIPSVEEQDMLVIWSTDPQGMGVIASFDGAHKVVIHRTTTRDAYTAAGIKLVQVDWADWQAIPDAT